MRFRIRCHPELSRFDDFFFKTIAFGYKEGINRDGDEVELPLQHLLDYEKLNMNNSIVDVGLNALWLRRDGTPTFSFMLEKFKNKVIRMFVESGTLETKFYSTCNATFGNCAYKIRKRVNECNPVKFICYSDMKYHFVGPLKGKKSGRGYFTDSFTPDDLFKTSSTAMDLHEFYTDRFEENKKTHFTLRFEGGVPVQELNMPLLATWTQNVKYVLLV